jgi:hypothetical protein
VKEAIDDRCKISIIFFGCLSGTQVQNPLAGKLAKGSLEPGSLMFYLMFYSISIQEFPDKLGTV